LTGKYWPLLPVACRLILRPDTPVEDDVKLMVGARWTRLRPGSLSALYDQSTEEVNDRARKAWSRASLRRPSSERTSHCRSDVSHLPPKAAMMAAVEILLADPVPDYRWARSRPAARPPEAEQTPARSA
jgi:hypothetical protein